MGKMIVYCYFGDLEPGRTKDFYFFQDKPQKGDPIEIHDVFNGSIWEGKVIRQNGDETWNVEIEKLIRIIPYQPNWRKRRLPKNRFLRKSLKETSPEKAS